MTKTEVKEIRSHEFLNKTIDSYIFNNSMVVKYPETFHNNLISLDKKLMQLSKKEEYKKIIINRLKDVVLYYPSTKLKKILSM